MIVGTAGVLFDMDGVLVATEALKRRAHQTVVGEWGGTVSREFYFTLMGRSQEDVVRGYIRAAGLAVEEFEYSRRWREVYAELLRSRLELVPGAADLVESLHQRGERLALVSSSLRWMVDDVLSRTGLGRLFEATISADDVDQEKPAPEPYLRALSALGLMAGDAVVIEDTAAGVSSARAAGCPVIALRHPYNAAQDLSAAAAVVESLAEVGPAIASLRSGPGVG